MSICVHVYMCTCVYVYMYICVHVHMCTFVHVYMCTCVYVYISICVHVYMCTCVYVYMCICVHVYTCITDLCFIATPWPNLYMVRPSDVEAQCAISHAVAESCRRTVFWLLGRARHEVKSENCGYKTVEFSCGKLSWYWRHDERFLILWNSTMHCKVDIVYRDITGTQCFCRLPAVGRPHT